MLGGWSEEGRLRAVRARGPGASVGRKDEDSTDPRAHPHNRDQ